VGGLSIAHLTAEPGWASVDFISDLHLQPGEPATFKAWQRYLQDTPADAVFILGDLFEAWVGDDVALQGGFAADCAAVLQSAASQRPLFLMHGNRDFLVGEALARQCGFSLLADPTLLRFAGQPWLLTHGDALCLGDTDYLKFREQVRSPAWIGNFLSRPLADRKAVARQMRDASQAHHEGASDYADVDAPMARHWLAQAGATVMIHGHTHRPAEHDLGEGMRRIVLSDWDAGAPVPRQQVLRLDASGLVSRIDLS
jgi:UDP-2,3-diacylglucosamine hydrolase